MGKNVKIIGSGSFLPKQIQDNSKFLDKVFFDDSNIRIETDNRQITEKFEKITGIKERSEGEKRKIKTSSTTGAIEKYFACMHWQ